MSTTKKKHKYLCKFYGIFGLKYVRVCTRTKQSARKYCWQQIRQGRCWFFTIAELKGK